MLQRPYFLFARLSRLIALSLVACGMVFTSNASAQSGAAYTMTNALDGNEIAAFVRGDDGLLTPIGNFPTNGLGSTEFDGGEGLDPLISADSIIVSEDQRYLFAVNAGSDSISSFRINADFSLTLVDTVGSGGVGPNSLAISGDRLFVSNIDRDGLALGQPGTTRGEPNDEGNIVGFTVSPTGQLSQIAGSTIDLDNRPANLGFSADGSNLIITSITAGSAALPGPNAANSVVVYGVDPSGQVTGMLGAATGTQVGNADGRNLASAIDFDTTIIGDREFVVVTEAREFNAAGAPPALPALQAGSVSVYELLQDGSLVPMVDDFSVGDPTASPFDQVSQLTSCWIDFGLDGTTFYVSNAINATISSFQLSANGSLTLLEEVAAAGVSGFSTGGTTGPEVFGTTDGYIDLDVSDDGQYLYQLEGLSGEISVFQVNGDGSLDLIQEVGGLPEVDTQGLVTISRRTRILVEFESNFPVTGTGFAPLGVVFHDGSFNTFGSQTRLAQGAGLTLLAEGGNPATFLAEAEAASSMFDTGSTDGQIGGSNRPLSRSFVIDVANGNSTLSFASMFLPSNDWFTADEGGAGIDVTALLNGSASSQTIEIGTIYDAGTELEDFTRGGGTGVDPFGLVPRLSDANGGNPNDQNDLVSMVERIAGVNLFENFINPNGEPIARFLGASSGSLGTIRLTVVGAAGDYNGDGVVDCADLDGYVGNIGAAAAGPLATLDIDGDGTLSEGDANAHITSLVQTSNGVVGTFPGDVNCDGTVDVLGDAFVLIGNLNDSVDSYEDGDLNFDGFVDVLGDAFVLVGNLGLTNAP